MTLTTQLFVLFTLGTTPAGDGRPTSMSDCPAHAAQSNEHFTEVTERGDQAMGFSHHATDHHFLLTPTGGAIAVSSSDATDLATIEAIRAHLSQISRAFAAGDFALPGKIHGRTPPGVAEMKRRRAAIQLLFEPTAQGGRVVITTQDSKAMGAVNSFLRFQILDHRTGDATAVTR